MKFMKKELQRLNCTDEEISLIMQYQKKFPILNDGEDIGGLCINARDFWKQLNENVLNNTKFVDWANKNIVTQNYTIDEYEEFYEKDGVRFKTNGETSQELSANGVTKNYMLSVNMAKDIAMYTGAMPRANSILKSNSKMIRKYFLLMGKNRKRQ